MLICIVYLCFLIVSSPHCVKHSVMCVFNLFYLKLQGSSGSQVPQNKYAELLAIIEELGKEIRPTYAGSKSAMERLKRGDGNNSSADHIV